MKVLCNLEKSEDCIACYMANLEDWNHLQAIAMSAEAQRRLEEDLRILESINVWHLVNLRSSDHPHSHHHSLYPYGGEQLDMLSAGQGRAFSSNYHHPAYLQRNTFISSANGGSAHSEGPAITSISASTPLPYPDLIIHASEVSPSGIPPLKFPTSSLKPTTEHSRSITPRRDIISSSSSSLGSNSILPDQRLSYLPSALKKEPDDYDAESNAKAKSVKFAEDTVFVERDMNSPFWRAFSERRRVRKVMKQRKQLNAQITSATYQPSIIEIVKSAFRSKDSNGNVKLSKGHKGAVLVYENSAQIPETFPAQYVYAPTTPRRSRFLRMITCQCCSSGP